MWVEKTWTCGGNSMGVRAIAELGMQGGGPGAFFYVEIIASTC